MVMMPFSTVSVALRTASSTSRPLFAIGNGRNAVLRFRSVTTAASTRSAAASYLLRNNHVTASCVHVHAPNTTSTKTSCFSSSSSSSNAGEGQGAVTNGKFLNYAMLYHDSVAFLVSNQLGIPGFMTRASPSDSDIGNCVGGKTPEQVAQEFNLSLRGASALLVTLCRMEVVQILQDSDESVDEIVYELTPSARTFLADRNAAACTSPFADTLCTNFITPEALLECSRPVDPASNGKKDLMSEHLEQSNEEVANNARHFMAHMNAQSYSCAVALPAAAGLTSAHKPLTVLDIGGGSAIYTIEAVRSNPKISGIVFELPAIKPITEEYIQKANLSDRIKVHAGDFFLDNKFPGPVDVVLLSNILHDWPDETNLKLIEKSYQCLNPGGRIVISELLLSDDVKSSTSSATSMNVIMLPYTKGRQYRPKEFYKRLERAGFVDPHVTHLVDDYDLVIATKPH